MSAKNPDERLSKSTKNDKSKSFFSSCGCGDKEVNKEAYVEINEKVPDRTPVKEEEYKLRITPPISVQKPIPQRPSSLPRPRSASFVKPKVHFTYASPN